MLEYLKSRNGQYYSSDDISVYLKPLEKNYYLDCRYYNHAEFKENGETISLSICSEKFSNFINTLYTNKTKKIANEYIEGKYLRHEKFIIADTTIVSYKEVIKQFGSDEIEFVEYGFSRFLKKDFLYNLELMNSPISIFDTLFRCRNKDIWFNQPIFSFIFLALESKWSIEKILEEMYLPYMLFFVNSIRWETKKKIDFDFIEACSIAYQEIRNSTYGVPKKSRYDFPRDETPISSHL